MSSSQNAGDVEPEFKYGSRLAAGQIRVLRFVPRLTEDEPLSLEILTTTLPEDETKTEKAGQRYIALSYVWGKEPPDRRIMLDGRAFFVGPNLEAALKRLNGHVELPIWIDAICINQRDDEEKSIQVDRMRDVYRFAERTMIWLGEGYQESGGARKAEDQEAKTREVEDMVERLEILGERAKATEILRLEPRDVALWINRASNSTVSSEAKKRLEIRAAVELVLSDVRSQRLRFSASDLALFVDVTYRDWFHRVWVVQELCVSRTAEFMIGSKTIARDNFMAGFQLINFWIVGELKRAMGRSLLLSLPPFVVSCAWRNGLPFLTFLFKGLLIQRAIPSARAATTLGTFKRCEKRSDARIDLKGLLIRAFSPIAGGTLNATLPKDRVIAQLGIASDRASLNIEVKYGQGKSYQEVYIDVAGKLLSRGHIDILSICRPRLGDSARDTALPTWVPDWSKPLRYAWGQFSEERIFNASGKHDSQEVTLNEEPVSRTVHLKAFWIGEIESLQHGTAEGPSTPVARDLKTVEVVAELLAGANSRYTKKELSEGLLKIPVADREFNDLGQVVRATNKSSWEYTWLKWAGESTWLGALLPSTHGYRERMAELNDGLLCRTDTYYVGFCPNTAAQGDEVWLPHGAHVPYVFRKFEDGHRKLVGEAHMYGVMDGELLESNPRSEVLAVQ